MMFSDQNPIIEDDVQTTLRNISRTLEYIAESLPIPVTENDDGEAVLIWTENQLIGLVLLIKCNQAAVESCFENYSKETKT